MSRSVDDNRKVHGTFETAEGAMDRARELHTKTGNLICVFNLDGADPPYLHDFIDQACIQCGAKDKEFNEFHYESGTCICVNCIEKNNAETYQLIGRAFLEDNIIDMGVFDDNED